VDGVRRLRFPPSFAQVLGGLALAAILLPVVVVLGSVILPSRPCVDAPCLHPELMLMSYGIIAEAALLLAALLVLVAWGLSWLLRVALHGSRA